MVVLDRPNDFLTSMVRIVSMENSFLVSFGAVDDNGNFERSSDIEFDYILHTSNWDDIDELIDSILNDAIPCSVAQVDEVFFE